MEEQLLRDLTSEHLLPLFSGAQLLTDRIDSSTRDACVALFDPCTIHFKIARDDNYRLAIHRSQKFDKVGDGNVTEKSVIEAFVEVVKDIEPGLATNYRADLLSTFQRRVVVKTIGEISAHRILLEAIDQLALWATQLYEGKPISAAFGFVPGQEGSPVTLHNICQEDFSSVISNGIDTMFTFDFEGRLLGHEVLSHPPFPSFSPYRQGQVADWATDGKIALVLNRLGEILVFKGQKLLFARRSGTWHFLTHEPILSQMGKSGGVAVKRAVYESCIDASFARTGACVGIVMQSQLRKWKTIAPKNDDQLDAADPLKSQTLRKMVAGRPFQELDRRLRQELLAIDGATLLGPNGEILAVGAILSVPGGSTGGGRLAAAKALSALGLGIKVSQDGGIRGYVAGQEDPKFLVM